jgi:hypothetical protein
MRLQIIDALAMDLIFSDDRTDNRSLSFISLHLIIQFKTKPKNTTKKD